MSRSSTGRQLARTLLQRVSQPSTSKIRCATTTHLARPFSSSHSRLAQGDDTRRPAILSSLRDITGAESTPTSTTTTTTTTTTTVADRPSSSSPSSAGPASSKPTMGDLAVLINPVQAVMRRAANDARFVETNFMGGQNDPMAVLESQVHEASKNNETYHFHIYSHRHNTHVTVTRPNRDAIVSLSCGNLGFRKSGRKHYDAAYQLGAYVIDKLQQQGLHNEIMKMEVVLRGFGQGREAVTKVLLGNEGRLWRDKIVKVADATRLKFGGTRSKKPRRLG